MGQPAASDSQLPHGAQHGDSHGWIIWTTEVQDPKGIWMPNGNQSARSEAGGGFHCFEGGGVHRSLRGAVGHEDAGGGIKIPAALHQPGGTLDGQKLLLGLAINVNCFY